MGLGRAISGKTRIFSPSDQPSPMPVPSDRLYLDANATAPLRPEARAAMVAALDLVGNPSSVHAEGRAARFAVESARTAVAALAGTPARALVFTGGGTEAANLALTPGLRRGTQPGCDLLLVAAGEHPCVLAGHRFPVDSVRVLPLDGQGRLDLAGLSAALAEAVEAGARPMLALQGANNETGVLQPVAEAARLVHQAGGLVVCDAVQMAGRMPLGDLGDADVLLMSGHKLGGPKGVGALAFRHEDLHINDPLVRGGGQERGQRAGTENVAAIAGFGAAAEAAGRGLAEEAARLAGLRDGMEGAVRSLFPEISIFSEGAPRLPNTSAFALPDLPAETLLMALDLAGVAVSSGSACSSGKVRPSHVLEAMGVRPELAKGALRVSLSWQTRAEDIDRFCETFQKTVRNVSARRRRPAA